MADWLPGWPADRLAGRPAGWLAGWPSKRGGEAKRKKKIMKNQDLKEMNKFSFIFELSGAKLMKIE